MDSQRAARAWRKGRCVVGRQAHPNKHRGVWARLSPGTMATRHHTTNMSIMSQHVPIVESTPIDQGLGTGRAASTSPRTVARRVDARRSQRLPAMLHAGRVTGGTWRAASIKRLSDFFDEIFPHYTEVPP